MKTMLSLAAALAAALSLSGCQKADDAVFGQRVRAYLLEHPEVLQEASVKLQEKARLEQTKVMSAAVEKHRAQLERDPRDFVANPDGKVTVVEFFDYNCAYCKLVAPEVVKLIRENPDVRFVFKEFAFQTPDSIQASKLALTPAGKKRGLEFYEALMAQKPLNQSAIDRGMAAAGVDAAAARAGAGDPAIERQIVDVHALATAVGFEGTPGFVVGKRVIPGADMDAVKAAITEAKAGGLKTLGD